jgi:hypothetical protein
VDGAVCGDYEDHVPIAIARGNSKPIAKRGHAGRPGANYGRLEIGDLTMFRVDKPVSSFGYVLAGDPSAKSNEP